MLVPTRFFPLCATSEIKNGARRIFQIKGISILLLKFGQEIYAIQNRCTHLDYSLDNGRQIGFEIICAKHGARFDLRSGKALGGPAVHPLITYKTQILEEIIEVGIPESPENL